MYRLVVVEKVPVCKWTKDWVDSREDDLGVGTAAGSPLDVARQGHASSSTPTTCSCRRNPSSSRRNSPGTPRARAARGSGSAAGSLPKVVVDQSSAMDTVRRG